MDRDSLKDAISSALDKFGGAYSYSMTEIDTDRPVVNYLFRSDHPRELWDILQERLFKNPRFGRCLSESSIVTCQGDTGWGDTLTLLHFDPSVKLQDFNGNEMEQILCRFHRNPIWGQRADFLILACIVNVHDDFAPPEVEELWARRVGQYAFEVCCIPFYAYDINLGDIVETNRKFLVKSIIIASQNYTFRVWFGETKGSKARSEIVGAIQDLGCEMEWSSTDLLAVSAQSHFAQRVADYLHQQELSERLQYETGRLK
ncbi:MAG: DUF4265 domain-containing protein [Candidatus Hydrogenedentes bacterium]|nr:DUF4265 domain-containing protein [Candidatus Hydrogenedentota bacterium]